MNGFHLPLQQLRIFIFKNIFFSKILQLLVYQLLLCSKMYHLLNCRCAPQFWAEMPEVEVS